MDAHLNADGPHLLANAERHYRGGPTVEARFEIPRPGFSVTVLFGPSGSGKTTALRLLAGLERADRGSIHFGGVPWSEAAKGLHRPPQGRDLGFLPQAYALFPHLTVAANLGYGLAPLDSRAVRRPAAAGGPGPGPGPETGPAPPG